MNKLIEIRHPKNDEHLIIIINKSDENKVLSCIDKSNDWFFEDFPVPTNEQYFPKIKELLKDNSIVHSIQTWHSLLKNSRKN